MYLVKALSRDKGSGSYTKSLPFSPCTFLGAKAQIHCVSARPLVPGEGLFCQIQGQSLNTHRGKHRSVAKCTVSRRWFAVEVCDSFMWSNCTQRFFLGNRLRFLCSNDTVAVATHFAMKKGQICFSLRKFLVISPAIQKSLAIAVAMPWCT